MTKQITIHCYISGKVQGVWFRASTKEQADQLGITGFVRNLSDGRVEVVASGEKEKISQLFEWLKQGPELAQVTDVTYEEVAMQTFHRFETQ